MEVIEVHKRCVHFYPADAGAPIVYLPVFDEAEEAEIVAAIMRAAPRPVHLAVLTDVRWEEELTPWAMSALFKNEPDYEGGADRFLKELTEEIVPHIESDVLEMPPIWRGLAGCSLAGLFALYAMYRTDAFTHVAAMSGSIWFQGFRDYAVSHPLSAAPRALYMSLGDREAKTKNAHMKYVEEYTRALFAHYRAQKINVVFEMNAGGHFKEIPQRIAKGIAWLLDISNGGDAEQSLKLLP